MRLAQYRAKQNRSTYGQRLDAYLSLGKPVVVTEAGCCAYKGAEDKRTKEAAASSLSITGTPTRSSPGTSEMRICKRMRSPTCSKSSPPRA